MDQWRMFVSFDPFVVVMIILVMRHSFVLAITVRWSTTVMLSVGMLLKPYSQNFQRRMLLQHRKYI